MAPYIFMEKNGIHIIDLNKTAAKLDEAAEALKQIAKSGKKIMFVATKKQAKEAGYTLKVGKFPFSASGKASASGAKDGFIKLIFDAKYGEILGAHMIGANVTEMIAEIVAIRKLETTGHELIKTIHPHPTMSEAIMEAAAAAYGEVIHL
jgi:pyruvate/2-oxoglutarate dehydrogenase complex dihydrolipoamide dehydrogenase (E3) component